MILMHDIASIESKNKSFDCKSAVLNYPQKKIIDMLKVEGSFPLSSPRSNYINFLLIFFYI